MADLPQSHVADVFGQLRFLRQIAAIRRCYKKQESESEPTTHRICFRGSMDSVIPTLMS